MNYPKLAICIPSFNRVIEVKRCVIALLEQIGELNIIIQVIDNGSDKDYLVEFSKDQVLNRAIDSGKLSIIRNQANIGMGANFMRAFEVADGDWLWMVADDDELRSDSINVVLEAIDQCSKRSGLILFNGLNDDAVLSLKHLDSLEEFIDFNYTSPDVFNRSILITNAVYDLSKFRMLLSVGYIYINTFIPHFMMQVAYMRQGNECWVFNKELVDYVIPEIGYSYSMVAGLGVGSPKHALLNIDPIHYKRFLSLFFPHNDFKVIIDLFYLCQRDASTYECRHLAGNYLDYVSSVRKFPKMIALHCFVYFLRWPMIFKKIIFLGEYIDPKIKKHMMEIRRRYS